MPLVSAIELFADAKMRWWVSGGHAFDLHFDRSWRTHSDTDISVLRDQVPMLTEVLVGWDIQIAAAGELRPWDGNVLDAAKSENNLWCRPNKGGPWILDVTISDGNDHSWVYRRNSKITVDWDDAVLRTTSGVPHLAPELQLLFKSTNIRPKDQRDAQTVIPWLEPAQADRLRRWLPGNHGWLTLFGR